MFAGEVAEASLPGVMRESCYCLEPRSLAPPGGSGDCPSTLALAGEKRPPRSWPRLVRTTGAIARGRPGGLDLQVLAAPALAQRFWPTLAADLLAMKAGDLLGQQSRLRAVGARLERRASCPVSRNRKLGGSVTVDLIAL